MLLSWWKLFDGNNFHEGASMSTTLLYHMYNLRGYRARSMKCVAGGMEIAIEQPAGTDLTDGTATVDFGGVPLGNSAPRTFTVRNAGTGPLSGLALAKSGTHAADYTVVPLGAICLRLADSQ